ncbi:LysR family transcriptional regulator [Pelagicoccus sp. NFK12]|uniref:HTH-type transcriptional regulator MetR n=1 Tax=Pelagicoccus enzymogenes TaxID=2773457 RepID=A0A927FCB6_9BACT|nr:LysR family transcriptional regulator [Pelagicoccus enzymogenes]MBD5781774.1 LysR family transcriptional regulator [Pelagicoccus enzymogenes]
MLEIRHFHLLTKLADAGNLARAGRELHLSQPAVSRQMADIEEHAGGLVFERKTKPIRFTPLGFRLLETAYNVLSALDRNERDLARLRDGQAGQLRIAVECHSCFDWLMPSMDAFRHDWPEVEMDLIGGFHEDPVDLIDADKADLAIVSHAKPRKGIAYHPLFRYEVRALLPHQHPLLQKDYLTAQDFRNETLITYPIDCERLDILREVLGPAGVTPKRRTTELTVAILQLVASGRGIAAMATWAVQPYLDSNYIAQLPIRRNGLFANLYMATDKSRGQLAYMEAFLKLNRDTCFTTLRGIEKI